MVSGSTPTRYRTGHSLPRTMVGISVTIASTGTHQGCWSLFSDRWEVLARKEEERRGCGEPLVGFEPTTARLRIESSTPELQWRKRRMPWRGFEPRRLSALPPQDSVSTS